MKINRLAKRIMRSIVPVFLLAVMPGNDSLAAPNKPIRVLSTIKPIQLIVKQIGGDHIKTSQLIPNNASPHFYSLTPSAIRKIKQADIIFRIGDNMEIMLDPVFESLDTRTRLVSLEDQANIHHLTLSEEHQHAHHHVVPHAHEQDGHEEDHSDNQENQEEHQHKAYDPHIWTSPYNAIAMATSIATTLGKLDPDNAPAYQSNLENFKRRIQSISQTLKKKLTPLKSKPYIVFHPSWQYFAHTFGLHQASVVSLQESITPGIKNLLQVRQKISTQNIHCLFYGPEISQQRIQTLSEKLDMNKTYIDVLGSTEKTYADWLEKMGKQVESCLKFRK